MKHLLVVVHVVVRALVLTALVGSMSMSMSAQHGPVVHAAGPDSQTGAHGLSPGTAPVPRVPAAPAAVTTVPIALAVDGTTGDALVVSYHSNSATGGASGPGRVDVLATRRGGLHLLWTVAVGVGSDSILLDQRSGHAFVLNVGPGDKYRGFTGGSVSVLDLRALEAATPRTSACGRRPWAACCRARWPSIGRRDASSWRAGSSVRQGSFRPPSAGA